MSGERILVVEDNSITATDLQDSLQGAGYVVSAVISRGEKAIEEADRIINSL